MHKRIITGLGAALLMAVLEPVLAQETQPPAAAPALAFEVASIKPAPPIDPAKIMGGKLHIGMSIDAARVDIGSLSLADLIRIAYKIKPHQLIAFLDLIANLGHDLNHCAASLEREIY